MKYYMLLYSVVSLAASPGRDPFYYPQGTHRITCTAIGTLNEHMCFAFIVLDGCCYKVHINDTIGEFKVLAISLKGVLLQDAKKVTHMISLSVTEKV